MQKTTLLLCVILLPACTNPSRLGELSCNDVQKACYRGNLFDRSATIDRYGMRAYRDYRSMYGNDPR